MRNNNARFTRVVRIATLVAVTGFLSLVVSRPALAQEGVTAETCAGCHSELTEKFALGKHGQAADKRSPAAKGSCLVCHVDSAKHAESGDKALAYKLGKDSKLTVEQRNATCLQCHDKGKTAMWKGSMHESRGLACMDCHSVHKGNEKNLIKIPQQETCFRCHGSVKAAIKRKSHHPINEGKVKCSDCHNPHGTATKKLISANTVNEKCFECHAEKRGPYLWEHRPVVEQCSICHTPHGSKSDRLLVRKLPFLCQSCHSQEHHPGTLYASNPATTGDGLMRKINIQGTADGCTNCHQNIHGSNHPNGKMFAR
ncbi:MAG: DmsE family decaheme c-type cytochrome [Elusimicrobiota bacterium]